MHQVQTPLDEVLKNWSKLSDQPVEGPVGCGRQRCTLGTDAQRKDLRRIEPWNRSPRGTERCVVKHDEDDDHARREVDVDVDEV